MSFHAVNPTGSHSLSPRIFEGADVIAQTCNGGGELRASCEGHAHSNRAAFVAIFRSLSADENFTFSCVCRYVSRLMHGHCFGAYPAPCGSSLFCFGFTTPPHKEHASGTPDFSALRVTVSVPDPP